MKRSNTLAPGLYEYEIFVSNEAGISRTEYASLLVGEKCDLGFQLRDAGGDGWKGEGTMCVTVSNSLGQTIMETTFEDNAILDLSRFGSGMYFVRFETEKGVTLQRINLIK